MATYGLLWPRRPLESFMSAAGMHTTTGVGVTAAIGRPSISAIDFPRRSHLSSMLYSERSSSMTRAASRCIADVTCEETSRVIATVELSAPPGEAPDRRYGSGWPLRAAMHDLGRRWATGGPASRPGAGRL